MTASLLKFFRERGPDNLPLHFPGTPEGFPVLGAPGSLRREESREIPLRLDYKQRRFRLGDPEDAAQFADVMDHIGAGLYLLYKRLDRWPDNEEAPIVHLEWYQVYGEVPPSRA